MTFAKYTNDTGIVGIFVIAFILLIYQLLPGPASVDSFPPLPSSVKSDLSGDTVQVSNVLAYFSNNYRQFTTDFYRSWFQKSTIFPFPPIRLNYPPEFAFTAIKDQTQSTYLEEYVYPFRDSLYVNGFEPFDQSGNPRYWGSSRMLAGGSYFETKTTLRYYPSSVSVRLLVWLGMLISSVLLWKLGKQIVLNE